MGVCRFWWKTWRRRPLFPSVLLMDQEQWTFFCAWKQMCGLSGDAHSVVIDETSAYTFSALSFHDPYKAVSQRTNSSVTTQVHWEAISLYTQQQGYDPQLQYTQRFWCCCCSTQHSDKSHFVLVKRGEKRAENALKNSLHGATMSLRCEIQLIMTEVCLYVYTSKKGQAITY